MYKLIAMDLDGTLLTDNKNISLENLKFIYQIIDLGYELVIATGRRYFSAKEFTKDIKRKITILANNGNIIRSSPDDKFILSKFLNKDDLKNVMITGNKRSLYPIVHVDYYEDTIDMIIEKQASDSSYSNYLSKDEKRYKILPSEEIYELDRVLALVYPGKKDTLELFYKEINTKYPDLFNIHILERIHSAEAMLEVMNPLGSKWKSLLEYSSSKSILASEIIAIGDDNNDLEMILNAGLGISMKNGSVLMRDAADLITQRDNNNSGVAFELRRILGI